jgi:hypothetical protein
MRVVIAGGTGLIGRALTAACASKGYEALVLSRRPVPGDARSLLWDGASSGPWQEALDGADAVVNLAGESVADGRWNPARKKVLSDSRLNSTRALVAAISVSKKRPKVFISASATGYYGDRGEDALNEGSPAGSDFLAGLCAAWEREAQVAEPLGIRTVCLRTGIVLSKDGGALGKMLPIFKLGLGGPLGSGSQWMSWIALEDLLDLILYSMSHDVAGPVNGTAPNPVTNKDFTAALARVLGRPAFLPAPAFVLRLALGEMSGMLLGGQKVMPQKALESGFVFKHPQVEAAIRAALG